MLLRRSARHAGAGAAVGLALVLSISSGCVSPHVHHRVAPEFEGPAAIPGFARVRTVEFPEGGDGWLYSYRGAGLRPDVYIYPAAEGGAERGVARLTRLESVRLKQSLPARLRQGWFGDYRVLRDDPVVFEIGESMIEGHRIVALIRYPDEEVITHQYLFVVGSHFVKVRESHSLGTIREEEVERFARLLMAGLSHLARPAAAPTAVAGAPSP